MRSRTKPPPDLNLFQRGPMRAWRDHKAGEICIETTKYHEDGAGIVICRLPMDRMREAQAIVGLPDLLKAGAPFGALGIMVMSADPDDPLIREEGNTLITVGDAHRMTDAMERACTPREGRIPKPWHRPDNDREFKP